MFGLSVIQIAKLIYSDKLTPALINYIAQALTYYVSITAIIRLFVALDSKEVIKIPRSIFVFPALPYLLKTFRSPL